VVDFNETAWPTPPFPGSVIQTVNTSVSPDSWNATFTASASSTQSVVPQIHASGSTAGVYGGYNVVWTCDPVANCNNKCSGASDGCGGTCPTSRCTTGYTCSAGPDANGNCICNAPGYEVCPKLNQCLPSSQCCSTSCNG